MPIPALTDHGLLPEGIHECTLIEVSEVFGANDPQNRRAQLCSSLAAFVAWVRTAGCFTWLYIDGSFVTSKDEPADIDVVLELPPSNPAMDAQLDAMRLFDRSYLKKQFELDVFLFAQSRSHYDLRAFFQYLRPEEAISRGLSPGRLKGILRVRL